MTRRQYHVLCDCVGFLQVGDAPGSALELASPICVASQFPLCSSGHDHVQLLMGTVSSAAEGYGY